MAVVVVGVIPGGDQETYEKISAKLISGGQLPDGCQLHVAARSTLAGGSSRCGSHRSI
jgi:hypothetical protein